MREAASTMDGTSASRAGPRHGRYLPVGLLVIASRVGGIPALVDHDLYGLLVPPRNAAALAAAISRVLTEPGTAARLATAARQTAQRYTWPVLARQIAAAYLEVTGKGRPA